MSSDEEAVRTSRRRAALDTRKDATRVENHKRPRFLGDGGESDPEDLFGGLDDLSDELLHATGSNGKDLTTTRSKEEEEDDNLWNGEGDVLDDVLPKKRRTVATMNDIRLLGENGFPLLQKEAAKFKPKGKGHETQDLNRVLSIYQLWAHQLYPKTNLRDTLTTIEKLCHKRSVKSALRRYRDIANGVTVEPESQEDNLPSPRRTSRTTSPTLVVRPRGNLDLDLDPDFGNDAQFEALFPSTAQTTLFSQTVQSGKDQEDEDEFDLLYPEMGEMNEVVTPATSKVLVRREDEEELEYVDENEDEEAEMMRVMNEMDGP